MRQLQKQEFILVRGLLKAVLGGRELVAKGGHFWIQVSKLSW